MHEAEDDDSGTYALYGEPPTPRKFLQGRGGVGTIELFCHDEYPKFTGDEGREGHALGSGQFARQAVPPP